MLSRIVRNFVRLNLSLLLVLFLIGFNVLLVVSNYLACKISFELLGTENRPLGTDELVGVFFRAFFGQASLAHLYAMLVAVTVSVGLFLVLKLAFDTMRLRHCPFLRIQRPSLLLLAVAFLLLLLLF